MAEQIWTLRTDTGRQYLVGLYHGEESGHLVVHCSSQVILIDFNVRTDKNYSFFVEEELCELSVSLTQNGSYEYQFLVDEKTDTPKNIQRRAEAEAAQKSARKEWFLRLFLATTAFILVVLLIFFASTRGK